MRFTDEKVDVVRHDNIAVDAKPVVASNAFERDLEGMLGRVRHEGLPAMIAAEGNEVSLSGLVKALQSPRHERQSSPGELPHSSQMRA